MMRLRSGRLLLSLVALLTSGLLVAVGCSSFSDGSVVADEAGTTDGSLADAPVVPPDAAPDASSYCSTVDAAFCADFEHGPLDTGWASQGAVNGRLDLTDGGAPASPGRALQSTTFADDAGADAADAADGAPTFEYAALGGDFARGGKSGVGLEADVRVDALSDGPPKVLSVLALTFGEGDQAKAIRVSVQRDVGVLSVDDPSAGSTSRDRPFATPANGTWFHISLEVDTSAGTIVGRVDGGNSLVASGIISGADLVTLYAGLTTAPASQETRVSVDNVALRFF